MGGGWRRHLEPAQVPRTPYVGTPDYEIEIEIFGHPTIRNRMLMTDVDDLAWPGTAYSLINCIPAVVAAKPGFLEDPVFAA